MTALWSRKHKSTWSYFEQISQKRGEIHFSGIKIRQLKSIDYIIKPTLHVEIDNHMQYKYTKYWKKKTITKEKWSAEEWSCHHLVTHNLFEYNVASLSHQCLVKKGVPVVVEGT